MKIIVQVQTSTLGDIAIEEFEDRSTTNATDQQATLVELLYKAMFKVQASYKIPREMLDLGEEEYIDTETRYHEEQKQAKPSSAERNRRDREKSERDNSKSEKFLKEHGSCATGDCCGDSKDVEKEPQIEDDVLFIEEHELVAVQKFLKKLRKKEERNK